MTIAPEETAALTVSLWRHHDPGAGGVPGIALGSRTLTGGLAAAARDLYREGVRRVSIPGVVDAGSGPPAATVRALALVRDLTSQAIAVDWRLRLPATDGWRLLSHLHPPAGLDGPGAAEVLGQWKSDFHLVRCIYRQGPGFVQVRDMRFGEFSRFTIDDPDYVAAIGALADGAPAAAVDPQILADFAGEGLVGAVGETAWWMPYRVRRWPWPAMGF